MAITSATSQQTTNSTSSTISMPASVAAGDMLLALACMDSGATAVTAWSNSFNELLDSVFQSVALAACAYKIAAGGEANTVATKTSERSNHIAYRIPAAEWANDGTAPVISTIVSNAGSTAPNPGSVTFPWSATHQTIFVAVAFWDDSVASTVSAYPSGYTDNRATNVTASSAGRIAAAVKPMSGASSPEDPGAFTLSASEQWAAVVIAVKGLPLANNKNGTITATGGGIVTTARQKGGLRAAVETGGGVVAFASSGAHAAAVLITGGGVFASARAKGAAAATVETGGGVVTLASGKLVQAALGSLTGGGVIALARMKGGQVAGAQTGGGVVALATSGAHGQATAITGGGVVTAVATKSALRATVQSGGGVVTLIPAKGASVALVDTGGGVVTLARAKGGASAIVVTGGGVVTFTFESTSNARSGVLALTGGGTVSAVIASGRVVGLIITGGGVAAAQGSTGRSGPLSLSGGGVVTLAGGAMTQVQILAEATRAEHGGDWRAAVVHLLGRAADDRAVGDFPSPRNLGRRGRAFKLEAAAAYLIEQYG